MTITFEHIKTAVAEEFGVAVDDICGHSRVRSIVWPRHVCVYLARRLTTQSLPQIGRGLGWRDHTTIINSYNRCEAKKTQDPQFSARVDRLAMKIMGSDANQASRAKFLNMIDELESLK